MSNNLLFKKIEKIIGEQFPAGLDKIIESAGFDTERSIYGLNLEEINNIELYVNENKSVLESTGYEQLVNQSDVNFKFKPGHVTFLKSLPESLRMHKEKKENKKRNIQKEKSLEKSVKSKEVLSKDDESLKTELLEKVVNFFTRNSFELISDTSKLISSFTRENDIINCRIICPFCNNEQKSVYKTYWVLSNFQDHCKKHFKNHQANQLNTNASTLEITNYSEAQEEQLDQILGINRSNLQNNMNSLAG